MELRRLDDYQSWAVEHAGHRVLVDPWLSEEMSLPPGHWLFGRRRRPPTPVDAWLPASAVVLTAHFSDHLHPPTLERLPRHTPVFGTRTAAALARRLGFTDVRPLRHGDAAELPGGLTLTAVAPGFPYSHNSLGYVFSGGGRRLYLETHMVHPARAAAAARGVEVLVGPVQGVWLAGIPFVMAPERAVEVARALAPQRWVPTGNEPQAAHGLFSKTLLFYRGALGDFRSGLASAGVSTAVVEPAPGEALVV